MVESESNKEPDALNELGELGDRIRQFREGLQEGGPEVDTTLLVAYVDGQLEADAQQRVKRAIATWRNWHDQYLEIKAADA